MPKTKLKIKTEWDLTPLLKNDDDPAWITKVDLVEQKYYEFINKWKDNSSYLENSKNLKAALDEYENLSTNFDLYGDAGFYFHLRSSVDSENKTVKAKASKIEERIIKIGNDIEFFSIRLSKISIEKQKEFLEDTNLADYKHYLEQLFSNAKYILSEPEERILNLKSKSSHSNWVRMVSDFLSKEESFIINSAGKKEKKTYTELSSLTYDKNKETRDSAVKALVKIYEKHEDIAENELNSILHNKKVDDELRGASRPDEMSLRSDDIDPEIVDSLIKAVTNRYDISDRFYKLKAKLFGKDKLEYHERNLKYGSVDSVYTFEQAADLNYKVLSELDNEFGEFFKNYLENGRFDVMPKKGKRSGGFCASLSKKQPIYIFMNFTGKLFDVRTIAHEMGHAINAELIFREQNGLNGALSLATAEVASTFMEDFLLQHLSMNVDDETRLALMVAKLEDDVISIPRQISCYTFEQELHNTFREKGFLSKEEIEKLFSKHTMAYLGTAVKANRLTDLGWVGWSHIRSFFYVYSYASGLMISKALQNKVKMDKNFILGVKKFLGAGSHKSPKDIFSEMGVDITHQSFWDSALNEIDDYLTQTEALAKKLGKI